MERPIHHIEEMVEIRRDMIKDLERNRYKWAKKEIESEANIEAIELAIEG
ncbi:MAG: hypothetical protein QNI91_17705 [Arenicellales bacterium]|nr:hypothetical protein [Arenicellales bacterium]